MTYCYECNSFNLAKETCRNIINIITELKWLIWLNDKKMLLIDKKMIKIVDLIFDRMHNSESYYIRPNLDCNYTIPINSAPNGINFGVKWIENSECTIQICVLLQQDRELNAICIYNFQKSTINLLKNLTNSRNKLIYFYSIYK